MFLWDPAFNSFGYIPRSEVSQSYGNSSFNFMRTCHTIFHYGCTIWNSHQQCTRVQISLHAYKHLLLLFPHLSGLRWYHTVVLICISVVMVILSIFFMSLYMFERCVFKSFAHFWNRLFVSLLFSFRSSLYIVDINPLSDVWFANIFTHAMGCLFIVSSVFWCTKEFFSSFHQVSFF